MHLSRLPLIASLVVSVTVPALAWDAPGHRIVNQLALKSLPADFPAFARDAAAVDRISFLADLPDRWSHSIDLTLKHTNWLDHFIDIEQLADAGLEPGKLPSFRYDFVAAFAEGRAAHPDRFPVIDPVKDNFHTQRWPGFLPWTVAESFGKLKAAFSSLKVYREFGTPEEIANAEAVVIVLMGTMGHYVGDMSQPLHTTIHHDGWVGPNPNGYFAGTKFHTWIDSGLIAKANITTGDIAGRVTPAEPFSLAARPDGRDPVFVAALDFIVAQNRLVEPLYQLEREQKLGRGQGDVTPEA